MNGNGLELDLKLNLSPPRVIHPFPSVMSPKRSPAAASPVSPSGSCVSSENQEEATVAMVLVGCPRCLMYVMLANAEAKCPKCKSTVLLNVFYEHTNNATRA